MIKNINTMKNLLVLIVFTITSFFNSTAFSKTIINPHTGEEITLNENQEKKFAANEEFLLSVNNHFTWIQAYTLDPSDNTCINKSVWYTLFYYLVILSLLPFAFNFVYRHKKGTLRRQFLLYISLWVFASIIAFLPFQWGNPWAIPFYLTGGLLMYIIMVGFAFSLTILDDFSVKNVLLIVASILIVLIGSISYVVLSIGYPNFFRQFMAPIIVWMSIFSLVRVMYEHISTSIQERKDLQLKNEAKIIHLNTN